MKQGQIWYLDVIFGLIIFSVGVMAYYLITINVEEKDASRTDEMTYEIDALSSALIGQGYPSDWDAQNAIQIGLTNGNHRLDARKWRELNDIAYEQTKKLLGSRFDFFIYFEGADGNATPVEGICSFGSQKASAAIGSRAAYYYADESLDAAKELMQDAIGADVFRKGSAGEDLSDLIAALDSYDALVMEHPRLESAELASYAGDIEEFVERGGLLTLLGRVTDANGEDLLGFSFYTKSDQTASDRTARAVEGEGAALQNGEDIVFLQAHYSRNDAIAWSNVSSIAQFTQDGEHAIVQWRFGNGSVMHLSDSAAMASVSDFEQALNSTVRERSVVRCFEPSYSASQKTIIRRERYVFYDGSIRKMVIAMFS